MRRPSKLPRTTSKMLKLSLTALLLACSISYALQESNPEPEDEVFHGKFSDPSAKSGVEL